MSKLIYVVDDESNIRTMMQLFLENEGFTVETFKDGQEACQAFSAKEPDMLILDIMMPGIDGLSLCTYFRRQSHVPIIFVSAKDTPLDRVMGITLGSDDYITKPFNPLEVVARVKTQLRRYQKYNNPVQNQPFQKSEYDIRGLIINKDTHKCSLFGKEVSLTPIEFSILWYLCEHQGKVISSEELFENVWKEKYLDNNNTVMAHIGRLRGKLNEPAKKPKFIKTVWGIGYEIE